ncbi:YybH family protein [Spirosoma areae]
MNTVLRTVSLTVVTFASLLLAQPNWALAQTTNADEEAIRKVIIGETDAYVRRDFDAWAGYFVDSPQTSGVITPNGSPGSMGTRTGFADMKQGMKKWMEQSPKSEMTVEGRDIWNVKINGTMAWAMWKQHNVFKETTKVDSQQLTVLEKIDGQWKISTSASVWDFKNASPPMRSTY